MFLCACLPVAVLMAKGKVYMRLCLSRIMVGKRICILFELGRFGERELEVITTCITTI